MDHDKGHRRFAVGIWAGTAVIVALLWGLTLHLIVDGEREAAARAVRDTGNLARIIAEQTERAISEADQILRYLGYDIRKFGHWHPDLRDVMREAQGRSDLLVQLAIIGADGRLAQTSVDSAPARIDLSDRGHFRVHRDDPQHGLFISRPVFGRASGRWSIQITRAIVTDEGDFDGVMVASLDPFYFTRTFQDVDVGQGGAIAIIGLDGILRAQSGIAELPVGTDLADSGLPALARGRDAGFIRITGPVDRTRRLIGYRRLPSYPLMVVAGFSEAAFYADLRARHELYAAVAAGCTAALLALTWLAARQSARQATAQAAARETERRLRASEQRFRDVAETASDWFWEMDAGLRFTSLTGPLAPELSTGNSLIGRTRLEVAVREPGDDPKWEEHLTMLLERRPFRGFEYRARVSGGERVFSVSGRPVFDDAGCFIGYRGSATDITERKQIEDNLRQARDSADRANRLKGEFLATMSHEIRTPMNGILGALELLEGPNLDPDQRRLIGIARRSGAGLQQIIDDVLDLSKLEAGRIAVEPVDFDLRPLVRDAVDLLRPLAMEKRLALGWGVAEGVPARVRSDPVRLRQILINLVGNAVKFTSAGSVEVRVEPAGATGDGGMLLRLSVADTGIGIPADLMPRLFQRFTQGDGSTTRRFGGTGLGLAICRELAELLGGGIGVDSVEGEGSVFHVTIPCRPADTADAAAVAAAPVAARSLSVLVAEDNEVSRGIVTAILERAGHRVTAVADGLQACEAAAGGGFDVLLMDVQMPGMDGAAATRRIRALGGRAGAVPIVALTANAMNGHREALLAAGMDEYLTKPVTPSSLLATLARVASAEAGHDEPVLELPQARSVFDAVGPAVWAVALETFERNAAELAAGIRTAVENGGSPRTAAHALKGAASSIGAVRLARRAERIEKAAPEEAGRLCDGLPAELDAAVAALRRIAPEAVA